MREDEQIQERWTRVDGLPVRYFAAGEGPPLLLLHGNGDSAVSWRWVLPALARTHRVYAPDLPDFGDSGKPGTDAPPTFFARFAARFLDTLGVTSAAVAGNSLGGLAALHLALTTPDRVTALALVDSAGLGWSLNPALAALALPGYGEWAMAWSKTPLGTVQRAWWRGAFLFANPERVPAAWLAEQDRLALLPGFLEATLAALRAVTGPGIQRDVLLARLPELTMPTLIVWGTDDRLFPVCQAHAAVTRLRQGRLALIPDCGHLPHVERPAEFVAALRAFLLEHDAARVVPADLAAWAAG